jgi:hypothetical protein
MIFIDLVKKLYESIKNENKNLVIDENRIK